jgi:cystathionine beta-lyase/cystathionine gamma-synthase
MASFAYSQLKAALPAVLKSIPSEWRGTTFKNTNLLGRETFAQKFVDLISANGSNITSQDLTELGNAEDYLRVSTNISTITELILASEAGVPVSQVFSFASSVMPLMSILLTSSTMVHLYLEESYSYPLVCDQIEMLKLFGCSLSVHRDAPQPHTDGIVVLMAESGRFSHSFIDAVIHPNILYVLNTSKIAPAAILVIRKRMAIPLTTPAAEALLHAIAEVPISVPPAILSTTEKLEFYSHLQTLSGVDADSTCDPVIFAAGLPAICSLWMALVEHGGADIVMASTAYGGSSELTDIIAKRAPERFNKHTFDITGKNDISLAIKEALDRLAEPSLSTSLHPLTVLFVEIPTNPDMKVPEMEELAALLTEYQKSTGKQVLLLVDTTFAPGSQVVRHIDLVAPHLTVMVFISMSKSVSRGLCTAGTMIASHTLESKQLLERVRVMATMLDATARNDQLAVLCKEHHGVEKRCDSAFANAVAVGEALCSAVARHCKGYQMPLAFVTAANARAGFTSSTFSFNLPPFEGELSYMNEALAQRFVDLLIAHAEFKGCVSFGQDNGLVYATVPATSTQGAIKAEDKAKQAVGGVQLTRLSFPPTMDMSKVCEIISASVEKCYSV